MQQPQVCSFADLAVTPLVDELPHCLLAGVTPGNVWLNTAQHVDSGLVDLWQYTAQLAAAAIWELAKHRSIQTWALQVARLAGDLPPETAYLDKHTIVDLPQPQQLQNFLGLQPIQLT